jgi:hypothetical protein
MEGLDERLRALSAKFGANALSQACDGLGRSGRAAVLRHLDVIEDQQPSLEHSIMHGSAEEEAWRHRETIARLDVEIERLS